MPGTQEPIEDDRARDEQPAPRRRRPLLVGIGLLCLLALAAGLFTILRDDGTGTDEVTTDVTFGPEGDATTIAPPLPGANPVLAASVDVGAAGSKITVQGAGFKAGQEFRPVELHWDTIDAPPLRTAEGPRFSVPITIPADAKVLPDGHNIIAVQRTKDGKVVTQSSIRFFVVPARP